jgi:hypothetical protein
MKSGCRGLVALLLAVLLSNAHAQIFIGQTAGFTGAVAAGVKETTDGAKLYFDTVNGRGGVNGQKIELVSLDDKFDLKLAGENARKLIEEQNVAALFLTRGTPHTLAVIPHLDKHGVALVAPSTGAMVLHQPVSRHVFNVRATYQPEAEKVITHLASMGITRIAVHSGKAMVGNFGGTGRLDYTAHGSTINAVARLEAANKVFGTRICVSEASRVDLPEGRWRPIADVRLRGIAEAIRAYELIPAERLSEKDVTAFAEAYALLATNSADAKKRFEHLASDRLIQFQLKRIEAGDPASVLDV